MWAVALPGRWNNDARLRSEPPTIAGAVVTDSGTTPISRVVGCSLILRGSDAAALAAIMLAELLQTRIHYRYRCCVAMRSRAETRHDACDVLGTPMIELIGPLVFWFFVAQAKLTTGTHKLRLLHLKIWSRPRAFRP